MLNTTVKISVSKTSHRKFWGDWVWPFDIFLLFYFWIAKKSPFETKKNDFYFTLEFFFFFFSNFTISKFFTSWNSQRWNKNVFLNNLGSKHSLINTFGQSIPHNKRKFAEFCNNIFSIVFPKPAHLHYQVMGFNVIQ